MELMFAEGSQPWFSFEVPPGVYNTLQFLKVLIGFSIIIFVHELGHFTAAKWVGVRVDRFAIGLGTRLFGWRKGEGFTFGNRPNYTTEEVAAKGYGETDYCFKALPIGGYVKMLGQDDIQIDEKSGEVTMTNDPRAFTNRTVGQRALIVSAGVIMNLVFAALAFMAVFLAGIKLEAPVIGDLDVDGPAAKAGLKPGDRVLRIDGAEVNTFKDIFAAQILAGGPMEFDIERKGEPLHVTVTPEWDERLKMMTIQIMPLLSTELQREGDPVHGFPNLNEGDKIVEVNGQTVQTAIDIQRAFRASRGGFAEVTAERREKEGKTWIKTRQRALLDIDAVEPSGVGRDRRAENHILGMWPRRAVLFVQKGQPAEYAGFKPGDVLVEWDGLAAPSYAEVTESIRNKASKPIRVVVERQGETKTLTVTPKRPFSLFGTSDPLVGISFGIEVMQPVVAGVAPDTPAAALGIPRESVITAINDRQVSTWYDVVDALKDAAGKTVNLTYRTGEDQISAALRVPSSIINELALPPDSQILSINGEREVQVSIVDAGGKTQETTIRLPHVGALRPLLQKNIGRTVTVKYASDSAPVERQFTVTAENFDPWQARLNYGYDVLQRFDVLKQLVHADGNPLKAIQMGVKVTGGTILQIYQTMKAMAGRSVSVEHVSGPIGIFSYAIGVAKEGLIELTFFLAFLSVNLAVINFLPLPVVDGGLMVFLIIEKIKGKPLSLKTQMVSTIVGLALIVLCFLFVTIQDITKLF